VLVIHSRDDYRIPAASAVRSFRRVGATNKTLLWRDDAGHVLAADRGREDVAGIVADWLEGHLEARPHVL
jgi:esterase/lipase